MLFFVLGWYRKFPTNPTFRPSEILETMVAEGKLGVKSGEGFYKYDKASKLRHVKDKIQ
jgi:3-hydroxyacyl-CoA dehydrogenase